MRLSLKQQIFTTCIGKLIAFADDHEYGLTFGDAYRDSRVHGMFGSKESYSASESMHKIRLAVDFNLFIDGEWISDGTRAEWLILGEYWEGLHESSRWGGRFNDANHFSFKHWGHK